MIRSRLRLLGRFLSSIKTINGDVTDFASIYSPKFFDDALKAVNIVARYDDTTEGYAAPTVALNIGTYIKQVGEFLVSEYIKSEEPEKEKAVKRFLKLIQSEYSVTINTVAMATQNRRKRQKKVLLPTKDDIRKLSKYIKDQLRVSYEKVNDSFSYLAWHEMAVFAMVSLQVFNRRRVGDIQNILLTDFDSRESIDESADKEQWAGLSEESKKIAKRYIRFPIRGKLGRPVAVLVYPELLQSLKLLIKYRDAAGVSKKNEHLFGIPSTDLRVQKVLDACAIMRKVSIACGAEHPERLRGTELRKHIATTCVELNLSEHTISDLANFMGHADKIHKEIYRQPIIQREIIGISKLLEAAQGPDSEDSSDDLDGEERNVSGNKTLLTASAIRASRCERAANERVSESVSTVDEIVKDTTWDTLESNRDSYDWNIGASTSKVNMDADGSQNNWSQFSQAKKLKRTATPENLSDSENGMPVKKKWSKIKFTTEDASRLKLKIVRGNDKTHESQEAESSE